MAIPVTHYADIRVTGDGVPNIMGILFTRLHGFMASKEVRLAVALPKYKKGDRPKIGEVIRLFGEPDALNLLLNDFDNDERERWMCGRVKSTPDCTKYAVYQRAPLPKRPNMGKPKQARKSEYMLLKRNKALESMQSLPFFFVHSKSGNYHFPFTVEKQILPDESMSDSQAEPNSYGFSTPSRIVRVPEF